MKHKFIIVPIDKASANISFICKYFYFKVLCDEIKNVTAYEKCDSNPADISKLLTDNTKVIAKIQDIPSQSLPFMYWIPKMHKTPIKFRFLVSQRNCPSKPVSKIVTKVLSLVLKQHRVYCRALYNYTGINRMWIADNSKDVIDVIDKLNLKTKAVSCSQYDFSSLYPSLPHDQLKINLHWCIEKAFKGSRKEYISVYNTYANFTNKPKDSTLAFNCEQIKRIVDFQIENSFFQVGQHIFRQILGISMGWDPAPFAANLTLYCDEHKFIEKLTKQNYSAAKCFNNTRRFIDDLNNLNDKNNFDRFKKQIYSDALTCNKENELNTSGTFLDFEINIVDDKFTYKTFDKRDLFSFDIVKYPSLKTNIPDKIVYNVFITQVLRFARTSSEADYFVTRVQRLITDFLSKHCKKQKLYNVLKQQFAKKDEFKKFKVTSEHLLNSIIV